MIEHHALLYADLQDPIALLRGEVTETQLGQFWSYATTARPADLSSDRTRSYSSLMAASQAMIAAEILDAHDFGVHRCVLDVGGGDGSFLREVAARTTKPDLLLFDLPPVAEQAQALFDSAGLGDRARAFSGDFRSDSLPEGADLASLVRVLHDHDDSVALELLRAIRRALPVNGTLLVAEPMAATPGAKAVGAAYFGFYLLAMRSGRPRTPREIESLITAAGFDRIRLLRTHTPMLTRVMLARVAVNHA
jgi:demethylspheroidene O-methyltransferase